MPFSIDYRPRNFDEFVGNRSTVTSLKSCLEREDKPHAFLFTGPAGTGKTTLARICQNWLKCADEDFTEINVGNETGIATAREIISSASLYPWHGDTKIYLLDECHAMTKNFQNSILKILEEPPNHVYFLLCTTNPETLLKTVRNRCSIFKVDSLSDKEISFLISYVLKEEEVGIPDKVTEKIIEAASGCPRQALVYLDQVIDLSETDQKEWKPAVTENDPQIINLCQALIKKEPWSKIAKILRGIKDNPESIRLAVLGYMASVVLRQGKEDARAALTYECMREPFYNAGKARLVFACYEIVVD